MERVHAADPEAAATPTDADVSGHVNHRGGLGIKTREQRLAATANWSAAPNAKTARCEAAQSRVIKTKTTRSGSTPSARKILFNSDLFEWAHSCLASSI